MNTVFDRLSTLSEPMRVRILRLCSREELAVGELGRILQTSQPTVSRHLKMLDDGGWVVRRKAGTANYFRIAELGDAKPFWELVRVALDEAAEDPTTIYALDVQRLEGVVAARREGSEALFLGGRWDDIRKELFGDSYELPVLLALLPPALVIVDLGCGAGRVLPLLAPVAAQSSGGLIGVDRDEALLDVARERTAGLQNVSLRQGSLDRLPVVGATVDLALCQLVLHHVRELGPVFSEVARVLKPGGRWVLLDLAEHDREDYRDTMGHQHLGFSRATISGLAAAAGLRVESWRVLPADPVALGPALVVSVLVL